MAMYRFVHIGFAFPGVIKMRDLEPVMTTMGDWIRYSATSWILWTDKTALQIFVTLQPHLDAQDQVLVAGINPQDTFGRLTPWIWNWMNSKRSMPSVAHAPTLDQLLGLPKPKR